MKWYLRLDDFRAAGLEHPSSGGDLARLSSYRSQNSRQFARKKREAHLDDFTCRDASFCEVLCPTGGKHCLSVCLSAYSYVTQRSGGQLGFVRGDSAIPVTHFKSENELPHSGRALIRNEVCYV